VRAGRSVTTPGWATGHNWLVSREAAQLIDIALRPAAEGREGRPIGAVFVLGDEAQLEPYLHQLILNPCEGHPQRERNILSPEFSETIREFDGLGGAFIVKGKGIVQSQGNAPFLDGVPWHHIECDTSPRLWEQAVGRAGVKIRSQARGQPPAVETATRQAMLKEVLSVAALFLPDFDRRVLPAPVRGCLLRS
jgi:hypothetical protein